jgi:hypothetical protein
MEPSLGLGSHAEPYLPSYGNSHSKASNPTSYQCQGSVLLRKGNTCISQGTVLFLVKGLGNHDLELVYFSFFFWGSTVRR